MRHAKLVLAFIIFASVAARGENELYERWKERREALKKDPTVIRYYTFEDISSSSDRVKNLTGKSGNLTFSPVKAGKKIVDDLKIIEGRFPGKKAVRLDRGYYTGPVTDIENRSFTAECWFRRSGPATKYEEIKATASTLLMCGGGPKGWILGIGSARVSSLPGTGSDGKSNVYHQARATGKSAVPQGVWTHAAMTWNGETILFYLNGAPAGKVKHDGQYNPAKTSLLAGYDTSEIIDLDEVVIYNRVLSPDEIQKAGSGEKGMGAEKVKELLEKADRLIEKGDFRNARLEYKKIKDVGGMDNLLELSLFSEAESYRLEKNYQQAHKTVDSILEIKNLSPNYTAYALFTRADIYGLEKKHDRSREAYSMIAGTKGVSGNDIMRAGMGIGDSYRNEKKHGKAREIYRKLMMEVQGEYNPNEIHRLELADRLESIDGLKDGEDVPDPRQERAKRVNDPRLSVYVSASGDDKNSGTLEKPFASVKRAQEEVRRIKSAGGIPKDGISVVMRGGEYFVDETVSFTGEDSGTDASPIVYRSFPGEKARLVGGKKVSGFKPVSDADVLRRLAPEARKNVVVADLREKGITDYGTILNRGSGTAMPGAMEVIFNGQVMPMSRWPNTGWVKIAALVNPKGDAIFRNTPFQMGKFIYSGNRPERWTEEDDVWLKGYMGPMLPYVLKHAKVTSIDTVKKILYLAEDPRWAHVKGITASGTSVAKGSPYFAYNILSEIDMPGEWYIDRKNGKLYFWPPADTSKNEVIVSTLNMPVVSLKDVSNMALYNLTVEGTWKDCVNIDGGENNLVAGCTIRNAGQWGVKIISGWGHAVVGCDLYDLGEGGISLAESRDYHIGYAAAFENRRKLIPNRFLAENNHIYRFNRLCGGNRPAIKLEGIGQRVSHNLINDCPHYGISISSNNHIIEFNDIHDIVAHSKELGAIYTWDIPQAMTYRGNILKNNFIHHVTGHFSPNDSHGVRAVHIDGLSSNLTLSGNVLYRTNGMSSSAPDCRFENNVFVDCFPGISQGNRSNIVEAENKLTQSGINAVRAWRKFDYRMPPWSTRYPQLLIALEKEKRPLGWPRNITIERNIGVGGPLLTISGSIRKDLQVQNNIENSDPFFYDKKKADFRIRPGSPVFGSVGLQPIPFEKIGLYPDALRASWPVEREIGKYFDPGKENISVKEKEANIYRRTKEVRIDGKLEKDEWLGLDRSKAILFDRYYKSSQEAGPASYAWLMYDDSYMYVGIEHGPDPWKESMALTLKDLTANWASTEVAVEGRVESDTKSWWLPDMDTGPIFIFTGFANGNLKVHDSYFKLPDDLRKFLEEKTEYKAVITDLAAYQWTAEFKIPLSAMGIVPGDIRNTRFNIGVTRRSDWVGWMYTGGKIWRLEEGGRINFIK